LVLLFFFFKEDFCLIGFCKIYRKVGRADCGNDFQTGSRSRFEDKQDMKETNVYTKIITDENLMETIPHGSQDYPFRYYYEHLAQFDFNCIDWHWHTELEFVYIQSGTVTAWIGEKQLELLKEVYRSKKIDVVE
jgi:hypothetical protein